MPHSFVSVLVIHDHMFSRLASGPRLHSLAQYQAAQTTNDGLPQRWLLLCYNRPSKAEHPAVKSPELSLLLLTGRQVAIQHSMPVSVNLHLHVQTAYMSDTWGVTEVPRRGFQTYLTYLRTTTAAFSHREGLGDFGRRLCCSV